MRRQKVAPALWLWVLAALVPPDLCPRQVFGQSAKGAAPCNAQKQAQVKRQQRQFEQTVGGKLGNDALSNVDFDPCTGKAKMQAHVGGCDIDANNAAVGTNCHNDVGTPGAGGQPGWKRGDGDSRHGWGRNAQERGQESGWNPRHEEGGENRWAGRGESGFAGAGGSALTPTQNAASGDGWAPAGTQSPSRAAPTESPSQSLPMNISPSAAAQSAGARQQWVPNVVPMRGNDISGASTPGVDRAMDARMSAFHSVRRGPMAGIERLADARDAAAARDMAARAAASPPAAVPLLRQPEGLPLNAQASVPPPRAQADPIAVQRGARLNGAQVPAPRPGLPTAEGAPRSAPAEAAAAGPRAPGITACEGKPLEQLRRTALAAFNARRYDDAVQAATEANQGTGSDWYRLAAAYDGKGDRLRALAALENAAKADLRYGSALERVRKGGRIRFPEGDDLGDDSRMRDVIRDGRYVGGAVGGVIGALAALGLGLWWARRREL